MNTPIQMPNVAFIGQFSSGKTTAATYLVDTYGYTRVSFAAEVRNVALNMLNAAGLRDEPFTVDEINEHKPVFRPLLQWLGTDLVRNYLTAPDYWVDFLMTTTQEGGPYVVDDLRFPNELYAAQAHDWKTVFIDTPLKKRIDNYLKTVGEDSMESHMTRFYTTANHESEQYIPDFKARCSLSLTNRGELNDLFADIDNQILKW